MQQSAKSLKSLESPIRNDEVENLSQLNSEEVDNLSPVKEHCSPVNKDLGNVSPVETNEGS